LVCSPKFGLFSQNWPLSLYAEFMFCLSKYKCFDNIFSKKIYWPRENPRIINTKDKHHFTNRQQTLKSAPNSKDSLGLTSSKYFPAIGIYQYSFVFSSHECGINSQDFKNKNTELLCAPRCRPDFMHQVLARR